MGPGDVVGGYRIEKELGAGGYGVVFRAVDVRLDRPVALKLLKLKAGVDDATRAKRRARFEREAKAAARIKSDHIAQVLQLGESDSGDPFIAMELVEGRTLADLLAQRRVLPPETIVELGRQICAGMAAAHALGVVHRDLKPANLMLEGDRIKILDFGVAKLLGDDDVVTMLTRQGEVVGTVAYMSPEQVEKGEADARSDIYSLGTILYAMLVGRRPFDSPSVTDLMHQIAHDPPPDPVRRSGRALPDGLVGVVMRCLEKDPARRFQTMEALSRALANSLEGTMRSPVVGFDEPTRVTGDNRSNNRSNNRSDNRSDNKTDSDTDNRLSNANTVVSKMLSTTADVPALAIDEMSASKTVVTAIPSPPRSSHVPRAGIAVGLVVAGLVALAAYVMLPSREMKPHSPVVAAPTAPLEPPAPDSRPTTATAEPPAPPTPNAPLVPTTTTATPEPPPAAPPVVQKPLPRRQAPRPTSLTTPAAPKPPPAPAPPPPRPADDEFVRVRTGAK